jgi:hypothetical protein
MKWLNSENKIISIFICLIMLSYFAFGFFHMTQSVTTDEQFWIYTRIPRYWNAIKKNSLEKTRINDKPGVSLALVSGPGFFLNQKPKEHILTSKGALETYDVERTEKLYGSFRWPIFIFNGFLALYLFWIIRKITNSWIALWSVILTLFSPILLGISKIINPDAIFWSVFSAAIFSYLALLKTKEKKFIFLTSFFIGFSLLTKYVANLIFPFIFLLIFLNYIFNYEKEFKEKESAKYFFREIRNFFVIVAISFGVFAFFMPAAILDLKHLYAGTLGFSVMKELFLFMVVFSLILFFEYRFFKKKIIDKIILFIIKNKRIIFSVIVFGTFFLFCLVLINGIIHNKIVDLSKLAVDAREIRRLEIEKNILSITMAQIYPIVFTLTPLVLLVSLLAWLTFIFKKKIGFDFYIFSITIFTLIFIAGAYLSGIVLTPRYSIILFPLFAFLASLGIYNLFKENLLEKNFSKIIITFLILIFSLLIAYKTKPFFYNYSSELLPKEYITSNAWGFGGYEAAQFLNALPESEKISIWVDYRGTCEFFKGICLRQRKYDENKHKVDYFVLTRRGQSKERNYLTNKLEEEGAKLVWELDINNRPENFIKIYKK